MIDVAFTAAEARPADLAVVIDVLRATSTATQALAAGYRAVICADSVERARRMRGPRRVLAGEERCRTPDGFDQGNSPGEAATVRGEELVLATTNGAPAIVTAAGTASTVVLACLLNLEAVLDELDAGCWDDLQIVCAGTNGAPALEDIYVAGRIAARLQGPRTDAALAAAAVARAYPTPLAALGENADARMLLAQGLERDILYCAQESTLAVVPRVTATGPGFAVVARELDPDASFSTMIAAVKATTA
jgi:2-phosphosulfolactate phosphatase